MHAEMCMCVIFMTNLLDMICLIIFVCKLFGKKKKSNLQNLPLMVINCNPQKVQWVSLMYSTKPNLLPVYNISIFLFTAPPLCCENPNGQYFGIDTCIYFKIMCNLSGVGCPKYTLGTYFFPCIVLNLFAHDCTRVLCQPCI